MERPPLAMLVAAKASEMLASRHSADIRAPFLSLSKALVDWWPKRQVQPQVIYENEFLACIEPYGEKEPPAKMQPLVKGAYLQIAGQMKVAPWSLPAGGYYDLDEDDFVLLLRDAAKAGRLPVAQLEARLKHLLEHSREPWHALVDRANRMSWTRGESWGKLDKRVRTVAALADLGATSSWIDVGGKRALQVEVEGTKRIAMLSPEELASLRLVIPSIIEPE